MLFRSKSLLPTAKNPGDFTSNLLGAVLGSKDKNQPGNTTNQEKSGTGGMQNAPNDKGQQQQQNAPAAGNDQAQQQQRNPLDEMLNKVLQKKKKGPTPTPTPKQ